MGIKPPIIFFGCVWKWVISEELLSNKEHDDIVYNMGSGVAVFKEKTMR